MVSLRHSVRAERPYLVQAACWGGLVLLATLLWFLLALLQFPASALLGAMIAGICFGVNAGALERIFEKWVPFWDKNVPNNECREPFRGSQFIEKAPEGAPRRVGGKVKGGVVGELKAGEVKSGVVKVADVKAGEKAAIMAMPRPLYHLAQGFAGVFIARSMAPSVFWDAITYWPILLLVTALTLMGAFAAGWAVNRFGKVPVQPAILGSLPGMSGAMVVIAMERGVDARIVALMQYVRLASVIFAVSLIAHFGAEAPSSQNAGSQNVGAQMLSEIEISGFDVQSLALSAAIAALALPLARLRFLPAAAMLGPLVIGSALEASGRFHLVLLDEVIGLTFAIIGLEIGLKFTKATLMKVIGYLPSVLIACVALNLVGLLLGGLLMLFLPVDPVTAFLATAPGSIETIALVAVASHAEPTLVLTFQTVRLFVVVLLGPFLMQQLAKQPIWRPVPQEDL